MLEQTIDAARIWHHAAEPVQGHLRLVGRFGQRVSGSTPRGAHCVHWQHPLLGGLVGGQIVHLSGADQHANRALAVGLAVRASRAGGVLYATDEAKTDAVIEMAFAVDSGAGLLYVRCVLSAAKYGIAGGNRIFSSPVSRNLFVSPDAGQDEENLVAQARRLAQRQAMAAVVVDVSDRSGAHAFRRWQRLARELGCVVVLVGGDAPTAASHQLSLQPVIGRAGRFVLCHQAGGTQAIHIKVSLNASICRFRRLPVAGSSTRVSR